jgi:hypothetical protein
VTSHVSEGASTAPSSSKAIATLEEPGEAMAGRGCWLPCGRTRFFDPKDRVDLLAEYEPPAVLPLWLGDGSSVVAGAKLECSVFRRLCRVLGKRNYRYVLPIYPEGRWKVLGHSDPIGAAFVSRQPRRLNGEAFDEGLTDCVLIVDADGFYSWLLPGVSPDNKTVTQALEHHICDAVGEDYFSHSSGRNGASTPGTDRRSRAREGAEELEVDLDRYRDDDLGILTFFQINTILEGLFNSSFHPRVFFASGTDESVDDSDVTKRSYTLGTFIGGIVADTSWRPELQTAATSVPVTGSELVAKCEQLEEGKFKYQARLDLGKVLMEAGLGKDARDEILREFLRDTASSCLQALQLRLERTRRALLDDLLDVTNRRHPLVQVEAPDVDLETISDVTESQLRGYVMLISAKLPIIINVEHHLSTLIADKSRGEDQRVSAAVESFHNSWVSLLKGIKENIHGLERAVSQSSRDRLLYEEEQVRAEQESLAELERVREDNGVEPGPGGSGTPPLIEAVFALAAVMSPFVLATSSPWWSRGWNLLWSIPAALVIAGLVFVVIHKLVSWFMGSLLLTHMKAWRWTGWVFSTQRRYLYEADVRLDLHVSGTHAAGLFSGEPRRVEPRDGVQQSAAGKDETPIWTMIRSCSPFIRTSYRVERISADQAVHKVHLDGFIHWRKDDPHRRWPRAMRRDKKMALHVVYVLVFQRFADPEDFVVRELRVTGSHMRVLDGKEVEAFRLLVGRRFINDLLIDDVERLHLGVAPRDALIELASGSSSVGA